MTNDLCAKAAPVLRTFLRVHALPSVLPNLTEGTDQHKSERERERDGKRMWRNLRFGLEPRPHVTGRGHEEA